MRAPRPYPYRLQYRMYVLYYVDRARLAIRTEKDVQRTIACICDRSHRWCIDIITYIHLHNISKKRGRVFTEWALGRVLGLF